MARRWPLIVGTIAVLLIVALQAPRPAGATHDCAATGSPAGPFDLQAYEASNWIDTYARTMELAGHNQLLHDRSSFALPKLETGPRSAGSSQKTNPYVPPVILKSIAWVESSWAMGNLSVGYGDVGPPLVSHSCAYGIMQVLSGMQNFTGVPSADQAMIGSHYGFNIARGAKILAEKWNSAPEYRPQVGSRNPNIIEDWYYALWSYHGFAYTNHPKNSKYGTSRGVYRCDGTQSYSSFPYQELVLGCVANPPVLGGTQLWKPVGVHLPNLSQSAFSQSAWDACSQNFSCGGMDFATPNPHHSDPKNPVVTRSQAMGSPQLGLSTGSISLVAIPPVVYSTGTLGIVNSGTGPLSWRAESSASWLKAQRSQGVALGTNIGSKASVVTLKANTNGLSPGKHTAKLTIKSPWGSGSPKSVTVTLYNYPDGTLLSGSGPEVYVMKSGLKRYIPNGATFEASGYKWSSILTIPDSILDGLPGGRAVLNVLADGNLVKGSSDAVYVVEGGKRRHVKSPGVMAACGYRSDAIYRFTDARLNTISSGPGLYKPPCPKLSPPDGTQVKDDTNAVYVMSGGLRRHVPSGATFEAQGFSWGEIDRVPKGVPVMLTPGDPLLDALADGNLLSGSDDAVFVMQAGKKRHISSRDVFDACLYGWDAVYTVTDERLATIPNGSALSGTPCPAFSPPGGALIKGSSPAVYVAMAGLKRHIPNLATLEAHGFRWGNLNTIPDSVLTAVPEGSALLDALADGNLIKGSGHAVYVMDGGSRRHITSPEVISDCGYAWDAIYVLTDDRMATVPEASPLNGTPCPALILANGILLKDDTDPIYVVKGGLRRHVPSAASLEAYGHQWGEVNEVPSGVLTYLTGGDPLLDVLGEGNLLRGSGSAVYVMQNGKKRHVSSSSVFNACGYGWDAVYVVTDGRLDTISTGSPLGGSPCPTLSPETGALLKGSGNPVYVMDDNTRLHVSTSDVFNSCGYRSENVNLLADSALGSIPNGPALTGPPCP